MERNEENGRKLQQSGEEYTHGGVKKTKFEPKVPTRRVKKVSASVESELGAGLPGGEVIPKKLQRLLQQVESDRPHPRTSSRVAFGFTGLKSETSGTSSSGFQGAGRVGKAGAGSRGGAGGGKRGALSRVVEKQEFLQADGHVQREDQVKRREVFDYEKYYPVTLPLRKPVGGDPRMMDEEEFGEGGDVEAEDERGADAARELGLTERRDEDTLFFFQFPKGLPLAVNPRGKEKPASVRLEELGKGGAMGKLLVYESGAVKFQIGDVILDALPGTECTFAQEVAAVNTTSKCCGFVGEVHKRVVLTPDITDALPDLTDLRTKP